MIPVLVLDIFAGLMLVVAALSACRVVTARAWPRRTSESDADIDVAHVLMGVAMAGMLTSGLRTLPQSAWVAVFAVVTAWFGYRVAGESRSGRAGRALLASHHLPHLIQAAAMIYMFAAASTVAAGNGANAAGAMAGTGGADGMGTLSAPTVGLAFVLIMAAWAVWDLDQISATRRRNATAIPVAPATLTQRLALAAATVAQAADDDHSRPPAVGRELLDPRLGTASRVAMGVTMALTLVLMI